MDRICDRGEQIYKTDKNFLTKSLEMRKNIDKSIEKGWTNSMLFFIDKDFSYGNFERNGSSSRND